MSPASRTSVAQRRLCSKLRQGARSFGKPGSANVMVDGKRKLFCRPDPGYAGHVAVALLYLALAAAAAEPLEQWCIARAGIDRPKLEAALVFACGPGKADCAPVVKGGSCYNPDDLLLHSTWAFNDYWLRNGQSSAACDFNGIAELSTVDPSIPGCSVPSSTSHAHRSRCAAAPFCDETLRCSAHGRCLGGGEGSQCSCNAEWEAANISELSMRECARPNPAGLPSWQDEFDGELVDRSKWQIEVDCWGGGNFEQQCYVDDRKNVWVKDGVLHIRAIQELHVGSNDGCTNHNENSCTWTKSFTSARLRSKFARGGSFKRGRIVVRAKLPSGAFLWPSISMLPTDEVYGSWAASGEIDIMQARGQVGDAVSGGLIFGGRWPDNEHLTSEAMHFSAWNISDFSCGFHVFELQWSRTQMLWLVDGLVFFSQDLVRDWTSHASQKALHSPYTAKGQPWDKFFYLILNVAVGGRHFDSMGSIPADVNSMWSSPIMQVDYVRVWEGANALLLLDNPKWMENHTISTHRALRNIHSSFSPALAAIIFIVITGIGAVWAAVACVQAFRSMHRLSHPAVPIPDDTDWEIAEPDAAADVEISSSSNAQGDVVETTQPDVVATEHDTKPV